MSRTIRIGLIALVALAVAALVAPLIIKSRMKSDRVRCEDHLRELGLIGVQHAAPPGQGLPTKPREELPPGTFLNQTLSPDRRMSWYTYMLNVFIEGPPKVDPNAKHRKPIGLAEALQGFAATEAWDAEANKPLANYRLKVAICPTQFREYKADEPLLSNYIANGGIGSDTPGKSLEEAGKRGGAYRYDGPTPLQLFTDGLRQTAQFIETNENLAPWLQGGPATLRALDPATSPYLGIGRPFGGCHPGGMYASMADGSVQFIKETIDPAILQAMFTRAGGPDEVNFESPVKHRSLILALLVLLAVLVVGVPLFVRTPIWVDVTYHDLSAWNILHGGTHYKDVFETNLPGMVWAHALVRPVVGWSHEAIRIVDLFVVSSVVFLLSRFLMRSGVSVNGRIWFVTTVALFYLAETEFIHCQRDGWMLLPAVSAATLRLRRVAALGSLKWSVCEGLLWGLAVWIKPHVLVPALLVWLVSLRFQTRHFALRDACWLITGGLVAGGLGSAWLLTTGTWQPMWDVLLNWNQEYYSWSWEDMLQKCRLVLTYFAPFSLLHCASIPLALVAICRRDPSRAILAALYLGWLAQATLIQKPFDYAHYPPMLLGLAVIASFRLPVGPVLLAWCLTAGLTNEFARDSRWFVYLQQNYRITTRAVLPSYSLADPRRLAHWNRCWHDDSWELKDQLTFYDTVHCAPNWADLNRVGEFLKTKNLKDRELICWHDSTHPLYVELGIKPGIRYPHVITAMKFRSKREQIKSETFSSPARYVVSDLVPIMYSAHFGPFPPPGPSTELPPEFPTWHADIYPWNQPVVFRSGRYVVHEVKEPKGEIVFPLPKVLWE